jgi:hypothetical protein
VFRRDIVRSIVAGRVVARSADEDALLLEPGRALPGEDRTPWGLQRGARSVCGRCFAFCPRFRSRKREADGRLPRRGLHAHEEGRDRSPFPHRPRPLRSVPLPSPGDGGGHGGGKVKLVLFSEAGRAEEYFIIPTKSKRDLLIPAAEKGDRKVWDGSKAVDL